MTTRVKGPVVLMVLDGWGVRPEQEGNAIKLADTPNWDELWSGYPHCYLEAAGEAVGLQPGQMGNSNVGHLNLGAGRVVFQDLIRINRAIRTGELENNPVLQGALQHVRDSSDGVLHLMGLLSDGGVHSHQDHLNALVRYAARSGIDRVAVHCFLDGRDVPPRSALQYIDALEDVLRQVGVGRIATVAGRYYAMDRDRRWDRTRAAYQALVYGEGEHAPTARAAVEQAYQRGENDEFVQPVVIQSQQGVQSRVQSGDTVIAFNFRADRMRQLTSALTDPCFEEFNRGPGAPRDLYYVTMTRYHEAFTAPVIFAPQPLKNTFGEWISQHGLRQLRIAETEKYAHVTFFFNGGDEHVFPGEDRYLVPSPKVATYDMQPEMSAYEVTDEVIRRLDRPGYDAIILNYANTDMVGHTGDLAAAMVAVAHVDRCLGRVVGAVCERKGAVLILADHGNAEQMIDHESHQEHTAHTTNLVPCLLVGPTLQGAKLRDGILADVAPTLLQLLGLPKPPEMTNHSLIIASENEVQPHREDV